MLSDVATNLSAECGPTPRELPCEHLRVDLKEILHPSSKIEPYWSGCGGVLFDGDCLEYLREIRSEIVDTAFADPPFNLGKNYGAESSDTMPDQEYVDWCKAWLLELIRILKPGGALFLYNLPRWNVQLAPFLLEHELLFRHWIAIGVKNGLPIAGRLYPAHYSLLYLTKGKPKTFHRIRTPITTCRHCHGEIRDYGGHRKAMHPDGVTLMDVWDDIPPVRHRKNKSVKRPANALSTKIPDRIIEMTTNPGDLVLDPFGGSGTTYAVSYQKRRRWIGIELNHVDVIIERLTVSPMASHTNRDHVERHPVMKQGV
jgi:site-specific DNA-methyltransferase (adenine-specific)